MLLSWSAVVFTLPLACYPSSGCETINVSSHSQLVLGKASSRLLPCRGRNHYCRTSSPDTISCCSYHSVIPAAGDWEGQSEQHPAHPRVFFIELSQQSKRQGFKGKETQTHLGNIECPNRHESQHRRLFGRLDVPCWPREAGAQPLQP